MIIPFLQPDNKDKAHKRQFNGTELVELALKYYDQLGEKYRKMIPLKKVYIPVTLDTDSN